MTDCDFCRRAISTVVPIRVFRPMLKFAYPEGVWKRLCETCLSSAEKTYLNAGQTQILCRRGKYLLCRRKGGVYLAELKIPGFSRGFVRKNALVCSDCLKAIHEVYLGYNREKKTWSMNRRIYIGINMSKSTHASME